MKKYGKILLGFFSLSIMISCQSDVPVAFNTLEEAFKYTAGKSITVLAVYSDPDECYACQLLEKEVFSQRDWIADHASKFVTVKLDLSKAAGDKVRKQYLNQVKHKYYITGYPEVMLFTSDGLIFAKTSYRRGGVSAYAAHLQSLINQRKNRLNTLYRSLSASSNRAVQIERHRQFLKLSDSWGLQGCYHAVSVSLLGLDPDDKSKKTSPFAFDLYRNSMRSGLTKLQQFAASYLKKNNSALYQKALHLGALEKIEQQYLEKNNWQEARKQLLLLTAKNILDSETAQLVFSKLGDVMYQLQDLPGTVRCYEKAVNLKPGTGLAVKLKSRIKALKQRMKK